jgi:8-oxo-dGTP pyrophosphatase MutT (NUDIX family)
MDLEARLAQLAAGGAELATARDQIAGQDRELTAARAQLAARDVELATARKLLTACEEALLRVQADYAERQPAAQREWEEEAGLVADEEVLLVPAARETIRHDSGDVVAAAHRPAIAAGPVNTDALIRLAEDDVIARTDPIAGAAENPWMDREPPVPLPAPLKPESQLDRRERWRETLTAWAASLGRTGARWRQALATRIASLRRRRERFLDQHPLWAVTGVVAALLIVVMMLATLAGRRGVQPPVPLSAAEQDEIILAEELAMAARPPRPTHSRLAMSREWIVRHTRKAPMKELRACWQAARRRGDLDAGSHTFIVGWTIRRDGTVADAEVTEPVEHTDAEIGACMAAAIESWTFPSGAPRPSIVRRFPLGPIRVR